MKDETVIATYQHVYRTAGFAISGKFTEDGKDYIPPKTHICLSSGIFCKGQIREEGILSISKYLRAIMVFTYRRARNLLRRI